eukprot:GHVT01005092.1.p3 GENE.GHVT01005092.1~~GHVT01005092.1.p3  ORF type:complete len:130 (+),score=9.98 GHVT01005092.1:1406-1795(+)
MNQQPNTLRELIPPTVLFPLQAVCKLPGAKLLFGGKPITGNKIPEKYGSYEPTAVFVPLETILKSDEQLKLATTELFGPFQVLTSRLPRAGTNFRCGFKRSIWCAAALGNATYARSANYFCGSTYSVYS